MEIECEDACYSKGIKETEQTDSSQPKPDVSGCEKESIIGIPETMEQNHSLSMCSSNNEFSLNGANDDASVVTKKIENNADDGIAVTAAVSSNNVTNGSSTLTTTVCSASLTSENSDKSEFSLSEVNSEDFNTKSIAESTGKSTKMDNEMFVDDTSGQILLPEEEESAEDAKPFPESGEYLGETDRKPLQNEVENEVKCLFVGAESESIKNPINGSLLGHKNADEEKNVDTNEADAEINENKTEVEAFLQGGGAEADVSDKKNSPGNAKHEHGSGIDLKKEKPEDLMDENVDVVCAETNSSERSDVPISVNAKSESHVSTLEELKFEDVLKSGRSKGLELAPDGEDQMDGDQGSVEIDFMLGDGDGDEHEQVEAQGDEIDSDQEEDNSELLVEGHDTSAEFHLHQLSEKVGLQAIEENMGQPIEFKAKGSEEDEEVEPNNTEYAVSEILSGDIHDKQLTGGCEQEKSEIYSGAAAASKLETVSSEGHSSTSTAAVVEEQERRASFESRPLIPMETSVKEDKLLYSEDEITPSVDQWTPSPFNAEVVDSQHETSRKEGIPEMLQYRKPTRPRVSGELDGKIAETMQIELLEEQKEEINVETDIAFKDETEHADTSTVEEEEATATPSDDLTKEKNQSKLEEDEEEEGSGKPSFDLLVSDERPVESAGSDVITEGSFAETEKNDALKQTSIISSRELDNDSDLLVEEIKNTEKEKGLNENGKTAAGDQKLEIIASKQSLLQQESVKKMHLPVKSVTTATAAKKSASRGKILGKKEADNDSGVDETTQAKVETKKNVPTTLKGIPRKQQVITSPTKRLPSPTKALTSPTKQMASARTPLSPSGMKFNGKTPTLEQKKLPMNKIVVGQAASPNLKQVKSKVGSMTNMTHRPGGGTVRVESKQLNFSQAKSKVGAVNTNYKPGGGDKKIESKKLEWNAKSKIGSLDNSNHKPGGGEKKIESIKLDFKDKATSKVGSVANLKHQPGGGKLQIEEHKLNFKDTAKSKVGSLDNVTHKPGGGSVVIFDDCRRPTSQSNSESQSPPQCMSPGLPQNGLTPTSIEGIPE